MAKNADWEMLQNSLQNLGEGALRRKALDNQHMQEMERIALMEQMRNIQNRRVDASEQHWGDMATQAGRRNDIAQQRADNDTTRTTSQADLNDKKADQVGKKMYYVTSDDGSSHEVFGTGEDAITALGQQQDKNPDKHFKIYDKPQPNTSQVKLPDGSSVYLTPQANAQFQAHMAQVNKAAPPHSTAEDAERARLIGRGIEFSSKDAGGNFTNSPAAMVGQFDSLMAQPKGSVGQPKPLTPETAGQYLQKYGDRAKAEAAAKQDGFTW